MATTKRCLQYAHEGVWLGFNKPKPPLPPSIKLLYNNWNTSTNRTWQIFNKYIPTCTRIARNEPATPQDYVFKASLNGTREKMKEFRARQLKQKALYSEEVSPPDVLVVLPAIMDKRPSMALMTMSRINESNRIKNATFKTALQRKLGIPIIDINLRYKCKCGSIIDQYGNHCLGCKVNHKALTADEVIGKILDSNNVFISIAAGPFVELGTLFRRFIENFRVLRCPHSPKTGQMPHVLLNMLLLTEAHMMY
jgi:hypothetical protein